MAFTPTPRRPYTDADRIRDEDAILRAETIRDYRRQTVADLRAWLAQEEANLQRAEDHLTKQVTVQFTHDVFGTVPIRED